MQLNNLITIQGKQIKVLYLTTLVLFLPLFAGVYFLYVQDSRSNETVSTPEPVTIIPVNLDLVQTTAHSAIVVALNTDTILYQKNPAKSLPLASLTKLVTAQVSHQQTEGDEVIINKMKELAQYGDSNLINGEQWNKDELIDYTLITSSNDGAHSLSSDSKNASSFVQDMNRLVAAIGLIDTHFYNESGLDNDITGVPGSKGTAQDVSKILSYLVKNDLPLFEKTKHSSITVSTPEGLHTATNTNDVANAITGLLVSKTGYTDLAGGNLAVVADMGLNEPTAFVVLKSSKEARFNDVLKLQNEYFAQVREGMR